MKITALVLVSLLSALRAASATITTIVADADTTLHESFAANNFGTRTTLQAGATTSASARTRALVSFNVATAVPPGATILAARLTLTATDTPPSAQTTQSFEIRRIMRSWTEGAQNAAAAGVNDATWSHRYYPNVVWAAGGTDISATAHAEIAIGNAGSYRIESTAALVADVQSWLDAPESNYGWAVLGKNEGAALTARTFASRENAAQAPALEIEFTTETSGLRVSSLTVAGGQTTLNWTGGRPPFQVCTRANLGSGTWSPVGVPVAGNSVTIPAGSSPSFYQVTSEPTAEYDVVLNAVWTATSHPTDFPGNAHWSSLVGGLHNHRVEFWKPGSTATLGMQMMAERGAKSFLLTEVDAAIAAGTANRQLSGGGISTGAGATQTLRFQVDRTHPLVTLVTMVAPSPDWFAGVRGMPLIENGQWVQSKTVQIVPWDTGTDSGATFTSPDVATAPRGVITRIVTPPLATNGNVAPMASFTFTLVRIVPAP